MTALAGVWGWRGGSDALTKCRAALAAQGGCGGDESVAEIADLALGRRLFPLLPEDRFDAQPVLGGDGRFALVADLRIDNREELGEDLGLSRDRLAGLADSSLLALALLRWGGENTAERLLGDFAFAWFDRERHRLLLARDPLGQRPLFWHRGAGFFAFASMPRGLLALPGVEKRADEASVVRYLGLIPQMGPHSFYEGIRRVEPGQVLTVSVEGETGRRYWNPRPTPLRLGRFEDYVEAYRAELDAAVARRLRGAGPLVATHLSGGWDSSAVTATAARLRETGGGRVLAFTSVPRGGAGVDVPRGRFGDEGPLAAATARLHPNIEHVLVENPDKSPVTDLAAYAELFDRPMPNMCNHVWLGQIRTAARSAGARVLLTGEIGNWTITAAPNTLLADYVREGRWLAWARESWAMGRGGGARLRGILANSFGPWTPDFVWKRLRGLSRNPELTLVSLVHPRLRGRVTAEQEALGLGLARRPKDHFAAAVEAFSQMDNGEYRKGVLVGWGIDKRDATADRRLIEFCLSLPLDMLLKNGVRRPLARAALADRLPAEVLAERRKGYQSADWHVALTRDREKVRAMVERLAAEPSAASLIDVEHLRRLVREWPSGGWSDPRIMGLYRTGLITALTGGQFILTANP
jgi:asparagine synthase (glutamine-hydrolysing)